MTLVEVVASLALLGTLLGAAVIAKGRLTRQWSAAQDRVEAIGALDAQLKVWQAHAVPTGDGGQNGISDSGTIGVESVDAGWPTTGEGPMAVEPWWWRAEPLDQTDPEVLGLRVIRYTAFNPNARKTSPASYERGRDSQGAGGAAVVDVLVYHRKEVSDPSSAALPNLTPRVEQGAMR